MKALLLTAYGRLEFTDVPSPEVGPDDVLVRVGACGICGSDSHGMDGSTGRRRPPLIMGHEAAGVIVEVGANVGGWSPGERVTFDSTLYCGTCHFCCQGRINLCDRRRVLGVSCEEYRQHGALAEYVAVPSRLLYCLPNSLSFEQAAVVEPLSIAVHAVRQIPVNLRDCAVVVGAGVIGLLIIQVLRTAGCGTIVAADLQQDRLDLACKLGADVGMKADVDNVPEGVAQLTGGRGTDLAFDAVGVEGALLAAVRCLRKGGHVALVGNLARTVCMPLQTVVTRELTLHGSCASCLDFPVCLDMIASGGVRVEPLISAVAPLADGAAWFERLRRQEPGLVKVILKP